MVQNSSWRGGKYPSRGKGLELPGMLRGAAWGGVLGSGDGLTRRKRLEEEMRRLARLISGVTACVNVRKHGLQRGMKMLGRCTVRDTVV